MRTLRLGVLGASDGNGHPYSWSAIFNGYDREAMAACPFPAIPEYLALQTFPADSIPSARVTHVWTQNRSLSEHIAAASLIDTVVDDRRAMIGKIDAVLLARDDPENHLELAQPFLEAGLPIFIDKPIAISVANLDRILELEQYPGQIYTCSALRYAKELQVSPADRKELGSIRHLHGTVVKAWSNYAVHIIEPVIAALGDPGAILTSQIFRAIELQALQLEWENGVTASFTALGPLPGAVTMTLFGDLSFKTYEFRQTFSAFRAALVGFVRAARNRERIIPIEQTRAIVAVIERGMQ